MKQAQKVWTKIEVPLESKLKTIKKIQKDYPILINITALDRPQEALRFTLIYNFLSIEKNARLELKVPLSACSLAFSIVDLYKNSNWYEREVWDLFGIPFQNHPDLRRILNMDSMDYFPMRKEYVLEDATREDKDDRFFGR